MQHFLKYTFCNIQFTKQYFHKRDTIGHFFVSKKGQDAHHACRQNTSPHRRPLPGFQQSSDRAHAVNKQRGLPLRYKNHVNQSNIRQSDVRRTTLRRTTDALHEAFHFCCRCQILSEAPCHRWQGDAPTKKDTPTIAAESLQT